MFAIFVLFVISLADLTLQAEWTYNQEYQWPGVCNVGKQQSPINIMTNEAVVDTHQVHIRGPLVFRGYNDVPLYAVNNGHTLKWSGVADGPAPILQGGPLRGNYTFLQFHFHWLSEHAIDGMKYPLEVHMVHIKTGLTLDEALLRSDGLAVVGVMFMVRNGYDSGRALEEIIPMVPYLGDSSQNKTEVQRIDVSRLLSHQPQSYYTYHGSLTTPMCQEVVTWIVMDKPVYITPEQYKMFTKVDVGGDFNYRSLQHPNGRVVYRSIASCASILLPTVPGTLLSLLSCLSTTLAAGVNKGIGTVLNVKRKIFGDTAKKCIKLN
ncbi:putative carbonic anhydrase 5 [Helicoverpa armigera]|uniref:putative carbonic anhydrase 5 n=1 Tax=Helicoverpa armigera TaxID=29058 RepID=UPI0021137407|nr:putative carbonic anhydrase 5 [Helicoverpa armigera]